MSLPNHLRRVVCETPPITFPHSAVSTRQNALFIGYAPHKKTLSSNFFTDLLSQKYNVYTATLPILESNLNCDTSQLPKFSLIVIWQVMPSVADLKHKFPSARIFSCPMADYFFGVLGNGDPIWNEYKVIPHISFSRSMHDTLTASGYNSTYVQYFPETRPSAHPGFADQAFLWQRRPAISADTVKSTLANYSLRHLHIHKVGDYQFQSPTSLKSYTFDIAYSTWFANKDEMLKTIERSAIYFAPRHMEGIGMSFLEAMAMGRCVIAPNATTMNEYISDGETGFLYAINDPQPIESISDAKIRDIQSNTIDYMTEGRNRWLKTERDLLDIL